MSHALQSLLDQGVTEGMFPSAQATVLRDGEVVFRGVSGGATFDTHYDLASVSKAMATATLFVTLWSEGKVGPESPLSRFLPNSPAALSGITLADLLYHRSGLPAYVPFFAPVMKHVPELLDPACPASARAEVRAEIVRAAEQMPLSRPRGEKAVYSDVGFILLGEALARAGGAPLDLLFDQRVAGPLALRTHFRRLSAPKPDVPLAPSGTKRPRDPAPGHEGLWEPVEQKPSFPGEVDDDNAFALDGVAGHAGLFGTADDVAKFGQAILEEYGGRSLFAPMPLWRRALARDSSVPESTRAMGFDTPSAVGSSAGALLGTTPPGAVGHLGFSGCSLWIDLARRLVVALNTNRTLFGHQELRLRGFRPVFHDAAVTLSGG